MKELLTPKLTPDLTYYGLIWNSDGQIFNGSSFETFVDANYDDYVVSMSELGTSSGRYYADLPGALNSNVQYSYEVLRKIGADPAITDVVEAQGVTLDSAKVVLDSPDVEGNRSLRKLMRIISSALAGILSGANTSQITIRDVNDTKDRIIADVDVDGNRTNITLDDT